MKELLDTLIEETSASLCGNTEKDKQLLNAAFDKMQLFDIITETDRQQILEAYIALTDLYVKQLPGDEDREAVENARGSFKDSLQKLYGKDSLYPQVNSIVEQIVVKIAGRKDAGEAIASALQQLADLPCRPGTADENFITVGFTSILSLKHMIAWFGTYSPDKETTDPYYLLTDDLRKYSTQKGFDKTVITAAFQRTTSLYEENPGSHGDYASTMFTIYGMALLVNPGCGPGLEPFLNTLLELAAPHIQQYWLQRQAESKPRPAPQHPDEIIAAATALIQQDGFSEYAINQAIAQMNQLPKETPEQSKIIMNGVIKLFETGIQYGNEEVAAAFTIGKQTLTGMYALIEREAGSMSVQELKEHCEKNMATLKQNLQAGESLTVAITRALMFFQWMPLLLPEATEESEAAVKILMNSMMREFPLIINEYVPEDKKAIWKEVIKMMGATPEALEAIHADETTQAVIMERLEDNVERFMQAGIQMPISETAASFPYIKQFIDLFPGLAMRFIEDEFASDSEDKKEFDRLKADLDDTLRLLSSAYTEKQFIEHQKMSLRRMAVDLGQFEKRRHLMLVHPFFPTDEVVVDANRVFFSGTAENNGTVMQACNSLGMILSTKRSVANRLHSRWQQLRESAVAVFDYSGYNPTVQDTRYVDDGQASLLQAASGTATAAYENGWAYVLGKPIIILTNKNQPAPFDIDIDPVVLEADGKDEERIGAAIQTALYGINRSSKGNCLPQTVAQAKQVFENYPDEKIQLVLRSLNDVKDATKIKLAIEAVLGKAHESHQMLIAPAFPGTYPSPDKKMLFHVTAFRPWSKTLEEETKTICATKGIEYKIGYEELNPDILGSIWKDISGASFIVADITNLNPNAVLELAMAQAAGRPVLIVTQNKELHSYFWPVQKTRVHLYHPQQSPQALKQLLTKFLETGQS
jgi:nucleoside 2-deoxyribosyltransferase